MPVEICWTDETKTIMQYTLSGNWTWDELYPEYYKAIEMEKAVPHMVDILIDLRQSKNVPSNMLSHIKNITDKQPDNVGANVVVTNNSFIRVLFNSGVRFYPKIGHYFRVANTMEEAFELIQQAQIARKSTS